MATYAIGDLQGCFREFATLLEHIGFSATRDHLWLVGDLVNRGPDSLRVLRFVKDLGDRAVTVLGNHDLHLLMRAEGFGKGSREDTFDEVLTAPDREPLLAWLGSQPLCHGDGEYLLVHAGLLPQWSADRARELAGEVGAVLAGGERRTFLSHLWGSEPAAWDERLTGWDRLRVIVNAMTRMRFCTADGIMEFRAPGAKGPPDTPPAGCLPWFAVPGRRSVDRTVVCGHWSALGFHQRKNLLALDSGCLWGGSLTAVRLEDRRIFQLPCRRQSPPGGGE